MANRTFYGASAQGIALLLGMKLLSDGGACLANVPHSSVPQPGQAAPTAAASISAYGDGLSKLNQDLAAYKANPDAISWDAFWTDFKLAAQMPTLPSTDLQSLLNSVIGISDTGMRLVAAPGLRVISFAEVPEAKQILVEWKEAVLSKSAKIMSRKSRRSAFVTKPIIITKANWQALDCPNSVLVQDGRVLVSSASVKALAEGMGKSAHSGSAKYLVLCGSDKKSGQSWLKSYRLTPGGWQQYSELFSGVPPYLLQNIDGKPVFSGANLVFTSNAITSAYGGAPQKDNAESYKIVLHFLGDHYGFDTTGDAALAAASQFSQAIEKGRVDLVKAWLVDGKLASIPGYLGLYNRPVSAPPFRLIAMAPPVGGVSRFRLITFERDDLVLDMGKIKAQWAVKAIYIAPQDAYAKKLMSQVPPSEDAANAAPAAQPDSLPADKINQ